MKKLLKVLLGLAIAAGLFAALVYLSIPRMDRWGASAEEIRAAYAADELVSEAVRSVNHAVTIPTRCSPYSAP